MKNQELFYPQQEVYIGDYVFSKGISIEIYSAKDTAYDWAKIKFTGNFQEKINFEREDKVTIRLGYDGSFTEVFTGFLTRSYNEAQEMDEVLIKDLMLILNRVEISNTYLSVTPQEILEYGLKKAGIKNYVLTDKIYPVKNKVSLIKTGFIDVIKKINAIWDCNNPGYFIGDTFYWGTNFAQEKEYKFEYGRNIIALSRENNVWVLTTVSMPQIRHGMKINIVHPKISGSFMVSKMIFRTNEAGFIRTNIYFEGGIE